MSKTEQRIVYKAGITRSPSDFLCEDGDLAECVNLVTDHEELKVVTPPERKFTRAFDRLLFVHEGSTYKNYICMDGSGNLQWFREAAYTSVKSISDSPSYGADSVQVAHVGNTLIVSDGSRMGYYLWNATDVQYDYLGEGLPEVEMEFKLYNYSVGAATSNRGDEGGCLFFSDAGHPTVRSEKQQTYNDLIIGLYDKNLRQIAESRMFAKPFLVRYALELYDGSYYHVSAPVMLFPCITRNTAALFYNQGEVLDYVKVHTDACRLLYRTKDFDRLAKWGDIVKNVVVFASDGVNPYNLTGDLTPTKAEDSDDFLDGVYSTTSGTDSGSTYPKYRTKACSKIDKTSNERRFFPMQRRETSEIVNDLKATSVFYKLFEVGTQQSLMSWTDSYYSIEKVTLPNLTTQEQLTDDYYSHCPLIGGSLFTYNSRLILADIRRGFYAGAGHFLPYWSGTAESNYNIYVTIKTSSGNRTVCRSVTTAEVVGKWWFFYPDPRATQAVICRGSTIVRTLTLTENPYLNGAYYFGGLPSSDSSDSSGYGTTTVNDSAEWLYNQLYTSEVNNPFTFLAKGNKTVGTGRILGMAALTTALSQGQFGQHPVVLFTSEGVWAMGVDGEGYLEPAQPMSREVCINAGSILETDHAVFFVTKKGLMVVTGGDVSCLSEHMDGAAFDVGRLISDTGEASGRQPWAAVISGAGNGDTFLKYVKAAGCCFAYDYVRSRILMMNSAYGFAYAYGIKDGTVTKVILSGVVRAVASYPDYLLQDSSGYLYTLYEQSKEESEETTRQRAFLLTRPMKVAGPVGVASLRELVNVGYWDQAKGSTVKTEVWVSDDLVRWYPLTSRFGAASKYYRVALYVWLLPGERLSGTIVRVQERRGENARV